jgi:hypothetical protein
MSISATLRDGSRVDTKVQQGLSLIASPGRHTISMIVDITTMSASYALQVRALGSNAARGAASGQ